MSVFAEVKEKVSPKQAAHFYIGKPVKSGQTDYYYSPFRNEKTPSFAVHDKRGLTDFGTGENHDIISFVQKLYSLSPTESANKIIYDFRLTVNDTKEATSPIIEAEKRETEKLAKLLIERVESFFDVIIQKYQLFNKAEAEYKNNDIERSDSFYRWIRCGASFYDRLTNEFINADFEKRVRLMQHSNEEYFFKLSPEVIHNGQLCS